MLRRKKIHHPSILVIQGSLHPNSHTALLAEQITSVLTKREVQFTFLDIRSINFDLFSGRTIGEYGESTRAAYDLITKADILLFGVPAYAPQTPGALKNLIDIVAPVLSSKRAGVFSYSDVGANYQASLDFIGLLAQAGVQTLKPVVHTTRDTFRDRKIFDDVVLQLIEELVDAALLPAAPA